MLRSFTTSAAGRLPAGRDARVFLVVAFVDAAGRGLFLAGSALFYVQVIGLTNLQVGAGISVAGLVGLLCAVPIGRLADRVGPGRTLVALQLWRAVGFLVYPLVSDFRMFLLVACFIGAAEQAVGPVIQSVAGAVAEGESLVRTMAMVAVVRNVAYALSALVATLVIATANPTAYIGLVLANAVAFVVSSVLLVQLRLSRRSLGAVEVRQRVDAKHLPLKDVPFLLLSVANGILFLHMAIVSVALPLWIVTKTEAPKSLVGVVLMINTIMAVTLQLRLSRGADDIAVAGRRQRQAGFTLAGFCGLVAMTGSLGPLAAGLLLVACAIALTLGEIWQSAGAWGLSYGLSPASKRTYYLAVYALGTTAMTVVGPGLLAAAVVENGPVGWLCLAAVFALTGAALPLAVRRAGSRVAAAAG